jgi:hypothetical protein
MLNYEATLALSRAYGGPIGAAVFTVRKALEVGGCTSGDLGEFDRMVGTAFPALADADCNTLCAVLYSRFLEARSASQDGCWYPEQKD